MRLVKPQFFPHWGCYAYSRWGFVHRVRKRLLSRGFKPRECDRLQRVYFGDDFVEHQDDTGTYRNLRRFRLYRMSRRLQGDRKRPLFELVERSGLFYCYYGEQGELVAFVSPVASKRTGTLPMSRLS